MEHWCFLQDYPGYSASAEGRIRNDRLGKILAVVRVKEKRCYISLSLNGRQVTRSLSRIIAETFVDNEDPEHFNTPIHLDGDLTNCRADNLMWRPRWFANKYTEQFRFNRQDKSRVISITTGIIYSGIWSVVLKHGVLFSDVVKSVVNDEAVYPISQRFKLLK